MCVSCNQHTSPWCYVIKECRKLNFHTQSSPHSPSSWPLPDVRSVPTMSKTFRGVVFHGTKDVRVEDRPFPDIKDWSDNDAIVQVIAAGTPPIAPHGRQG